MPPPPPVAYGAGHCCGCRGGGGGSTGGGWGAATAGFPERPRSNERTSAAAAASAAATAAAAAASGFAWVALKKRQITATQTSTTSSTYARTGLHPTRLSLLAAMASVTRFVCHEADPRNPKGGGFQSCCERPSRLCWWVLVGTLN